MQIHLVLPGLLWPSAGVTAPTAGLALPGLETLLGRAHCRHTGAMPLDTWLGEAFGIPRDALPHAALRRLGEQDAAAAEGEWLCADPVHLHFAREHLLLADASDLAISADEAAALVEACNDFLAAAEPELGRLEAVTPERWYLRPKAPMRARFYPLDDVVGRPGSQFLPEGDDARRWQRVGNELQVLLHNHPVNQARDAAGRRAINSVWFWGAGAVGQRPRPPAPIIQAHGPVARGLARSAGIEPSAPAPLPQGDALVVVDVLHRPALHLDVDRWREALSQLEARWFAPLVAALRSRRLARLRLSAPGDRATLELDLRAGDLWKLWRRPRRLETLAPPPP